MKKKIAVRVYTPPLKSDRTSKKEYHKKDFERIFVFDMETTIDQFQNPKFGYFALYQFGIQHYGGLIYDERHLTKEELDTLKKFAEDNGHRLFSLKEFMEIFLLEVYERECLCLGYNINFDLSRVALDFGFAQSNFKNGFSLKLTDDTSAPRIRIKHLSGRLYSVSFSKGRKKYRKEHYFRGNFLDVQRMACILTDNKSLSLEKACELFQTEVQKKKEEHGKVTPRYIQYCIDDVRSTYQVYKKAKLDFDRLSIDISETDMYSAASLGKQALRQSGILPFTVKNPDFPVEIIGKSMAAYYGGRTECNIRKTPTKVTVLDFNSMYPSVNSLMGLWKFAIADKIKVQDATEEIKKLVEDFTYEKGFEKKLWKHLNALVEIEPDETRLPVRTQYDDNEDFYNIGVNYHTYDGKQYYFLADVLAAKLLGEKPIKIVSAIKFVPEGIQKRLKKTVISGIEFDPRRDDLIELLVKERKKIKKKMKRIGESDPEFDLLNAQQRALKILVNATTYGIFIELIPDSENTFDLEVYSLKDFKTTGRHEKIGEFFNPAIGASITAGARLLLSLAEKYVENRGEKHAYMDTDSIFVPPHIAEDLCREFDVLNPYEDNKPLLEAEEGMEDLWFYGIASKRYCLYKIIRNKIVIPDPIKGKTFYKLHGLGHILNPYDRKPDEDEHWHKKFWMDILRHHYYPKERSRIIAKYRNKAVLTKMTVSTGSLLGRFRTINEPKGKKVEWSKRIKPFNFFLVGYGNEQTGKRKKQPLKPMAPYSENPQEAIYKTFIDYKSGKVYKGQHYWKTMDKVFQSYISHTESKYEGKKDEDQIGLLKRRHVIGEGIAYLGKEANNLEFEPLEGTKFNEYYDEKELREFILNLKPEEARKFGIKYRSTLAKVKERAKRGRSLKLHLSEMKKIAKYFHNQKVGNS